VIHVTDTQSGSVDNLECRNHTCSGAFRVIDLRFNFEGIW